MTPNSRFWSHVDKSQDCWEWTGHRKPAGYGQVTVNRRVRLAHRVSWEMHFGPVPLGMFVMHSCDNPPCVNPNHLRLGTAADNMRDRDAKGRQASGARNGAYTRPDRVRRGEEHGRAKLRWDQVRDIRMLYAEGWASQAEIARRYGVSQGTVSHIVTGRVWANA